MVSQSPSSSTYCKVRRASSHLLPASLLGERAGLLYVTALSARGDQLQVDLDFCRSLTDRLRCEPVAFVPTQIDLFRIWTSCKRAS